MRMDQDDNGSGAAEVDAQESEDAADSEEAGAHDDASDYSDDDQADTNLIQTSSNDVNDDNEDAVLTQNPFPDPSEISPYVPWDSIDITASV